MPIEIREVSLNDVDNVAALWQAVGDDPVPADLAGFIQKHRASSLVAVGADGLVGAILCATEGTLGTVHRVLIHPSHDRDALSRLLVDKALNKLLSRGVHKCHIDLVKDPTAARFWDSVSWMQRLSDDGEATKPPTSAAA